MNTHKLIDKMNSLLSAKRRLQLKRLDELHKQLGKLRKRRNELKDKLKHAKDKAEEKAIRKDIEVLKLQRKKGLSLWRELIEINDEERSRR